METPASDDEYEYEETTVVAEINGVIDSEFLADIKLAKVLGIDGEKPLLQLDNYTFSGQYEDTMGTCMLFKVKSNEEDPQDPNRKLEYTCLSNKKLSLQSVLLKKNDDKVSEQNKPEETVDTPEVTPVASTSS
ncbi:General transcription factor 3C polypeptide 6 [Mactra antiquata]